MDKGIKDSNGPDLWEGDDGKPKLSRPIETRGICNEEDCCCNGKCNCRGK